MSSLPNMLRGVVRDENTHTELLYNLMQLEKLRRPVLTLLFKSQLCALAAQSDMETQKKLPDDCGCADLLIDNSDLCAVLEVKIRESCGLTPNQPEGYLRFLAQKKQPERRLTFLVPKRWGSRSECETRLRASSRPNIETAIVEWEELIPLLESEELLNLNPILTEFKNLLVERYKTKPVHFSSAEVEMLFSTETAAAVSKLYELIDKIGEKSDTYNPTGQRTDPHGIYFRNSQNEEIFWIGNWPQFWIKTGNPLAFGVSKTAPASVRRAFTESYKGTKQVFNDGGGEYTVGWISKEDLSAPDAVERVWNQLAPVLEAVTKAGRQIK